MRFERRLIKALAGGRCGIVNSPFAGGGALSNPLHLSKMMSERS